MSNSFKGMFAVSNPADTAANSGNRLELNTVVEPDSGYIWIEGRLTPDNITELRILPTINDLGEEDLQLNPEGNKDDVFNTLGPAFGVIEVASFYNNGRYTYISSIQDMDESGNPAPRGKSPTLRMADRIGYKTWTQLEMRKRGLDTDIPEDWYEWRSRRMLSKPQSMFLTRAIPIIVNGERVTGSDIVGVFALPKSAEQMFIQDICSRMDTDQPGFSERNTVLSSVRFLHPVIFSASCRSIMPVVLQLKTSHLSI